MTDLITRLDNAVSLLSPDLGELVQMAVKDGSAIPLVTGTVLTAYMQKHPEGVWSTTNALTSGFKVAANWVVPGAGSIAKIALDKAQIEAAHRSFIQESFDQKISGFSVDVRIVGGKEITFYTDATTRELGGEVVTYATGHLQAHSAMAKLGASGPSSFHKKINAIKEELGEEAWASLYKSMAEDPEFADKLVAQMVSVVEQDQSQKPAAEPAPDMPNAPVELSQNSGVAVASPKMGP